MTVRYQKSDSRLLGTWKSSRAKTVQFWGYPKNARMGPKKRAEFEKIFGKLTWRFTRTRMYMEYEDSRAITKYRVVASDDSSVVIEWTEKISHSLDEYLGEFGQFEASLLQIHFLSESEIGIVSGCNLEFLNRVRT